MELWNDIYPCHPHITARSSKTIRTIFLKLSDIFSDLLKIYEAYLVLMLHILWDVVIIAGCQLGSYILVISALTKY